MLGLVVHLHERAQGMHPFMMADPKCRILCGQVALRYMNKVDLKRVGGRSSNSWRWKNGRPRTRPPSVRLKV